MRTTPCALLVFAAALAAQSPPPNNGLGTNRSWDWSTEHRFGVDGEAVEVLNRFDNHEIAQAFVDGAFVDLAGAGFAFRDPNDFTTESFSLIFRPENLQTPGFPDNNQGYAVGPFQMPGPIDPNNPSDVTWFIGFGFSTPFTLPNNQPYYAGVRMEVPVAGSWPTDGIGALVITDNPNYANFDSPGPRINQLPHGTLTVVTPYQNGVPLAPHYASGIAGNREILGYETGGRGAGGAPVVWTAQRHWPSGNPSAWQLPQGGTTSYLSAFYPDVYDAQLRGRYDTPGFVFQDTAMANQVVLFLNGFSTNPAGPLPLAGIPGLDPNSFGVMAINPSSNLAFEFADGNGQAQHMLPLTLSLRAQVQAFGGLTLYWQAFGLDPSSGQPTLHSSPMGIQRM